jgi:hypothetical protein
MKSRYLILFFIVTIFGIPACHNKPATQAKPYNTADLNKKKSPGKIEFTKEMHNFGTLKEGEIVAYSFQFKNIGTTPFRLTKVEPTCGCLSVKYDKDEIQNQVTSSIDVAFHTDGEWGNQIKTVCIETSNGEIKILTIGAYVENKNFNIDLNNLK